MKKIKAQRTRKISPNVMAHLASLSAQVNASKPKERNLLTTKKYLDKILDTIRIFRVFKALFSDKIQIVKQFPDFQLSTLKKDLQYPRDEQVLMMIGKGKGTVYVTREKD